MFDFFVIRIDFSGLILENRFWIKVCWM